MLRANRPERDTLQGGDPLGRLPAERALVHPGRIDEAVAQHDRATGERGGDGLLDMVGAGGGEQHGLGERAERFRVAAEQELADQLGARRAARLARRHHGEPGQFQALA